MAQYKGHLLGAATIWFVLSICLFSYAHSLIDLLSWLFWALVGGLFPDIDTKSKGQKLFYFLLIPGYIFAYLKGLLFLCAVLMVSALLPLLVNHRGLLHSFWFVTTVPAFIVCLLIAHMPSMQREIMFSLVFFCGGALSHLWLDFGLKRMVFR